MIEKDRYVVRQLSRRQWQVFDTCVNAPVYGAESMTENAATELARRLNDTYRAFRRGEI